MRHGTELAPRGVVAPSKADSTPDRANQRNCADSGSRMLIPADSVLKISMPSLTNRGNTSPVRLDITWAKSWIASFSRRKSGAVAFRSANCSVTNTAEIESGRRSSKLPMRSIATREKPHWRASAAARRAMRRPGSAPRGLACMFLISHGRFDPESGQHQTPVIRIDQIVVMTYVVREGAGSSARETCRLVEATRRLQLETRQ